MGLHVWLTLQAVLHAGEQVARLPDGVDHNYVLFNKGRHAKFTTSLGAATIT